MRRTTTEESGYPKWLPDHMRHTTPPVRRLRALLVSIPAVVQSNDRLRLELRARKIQHLCQQIDAAICGEAPPVRVTPQQSLEILSLGVAFLDTTGSGRPNRGVISSIYDCAALLRENAHGGYGTIASARR